MKLTKTQQENVAAWIAALRSGNFKQGRGYLCQGDEYCCLGVACEINNIPFKLTEMESFGKEVKKYIFDEAELPFGPSQKWFEDTFGVPYDKRFKASGDYLPVMNDNLYYSFAQIADVLQKEVLDVAEIAE